jgi:CYTH domain-containing protein
MAVVQHEIERKFLLSAPPEPAILDEAEAAIEIEQTYLLSKETSRRVRKAVRDGVAFYFLTEKKRISDLVREEAEEELTASDYTALLAEADPTRQPLCKTRWLFSYEGRTWELDQFHLPADLWLLEIELDDENEEVSPPPFLSVEAEVTHDRRFSSKKLASAQLDEQQLRTLAREYGVELQASRTHEHAVARTISSTAIGLLHTELERVPQRWAQVIAAAERDIHGWLRRRGR